MANVLISQKQPVITKLIREEKLVNVEIKTGERIAKIEQILPFRIKFTAVQIPGYGSNAIPPIPLQVIGYSNYIL